VTVNRFVCQGVGFFLKFYLGRAGGGQFYLGRVSVSRFENFGNFIWVTMKQGEGGARTKPPWGVSRRKKNSF